MNAPIENGEPTATFEQYQTHHPDRLGETIRSAVQVAEELRRVTPIDVRDQRDGTVLPAFLTGDGIGSIDSAKFDPYRKAPLRRKGTAAHTQLDSFIAHVNRFKAGNSVAFAVDDMARPSLTAIFDYHPAGEDNADARFGQHRASYAFPLSDEWQSWMKNDKQVLSMIDFAAFLEDHIVDVVADAKPSSPAAQDFIAKTGGNIAGPSKLIEIARGLQVNEASALRETRNLSSGEAEVVFTSEHRDAAGNKLVLPNLFMICIPVFARAADYWQILARFRYRKSGGCIVFWYELWRIDLVFEQAFEQACATVIEQTQLPLFIGTPEV